MYSISWKVHSLLSSVFVTWSTRLTVQDVQWYAISNNKLYEKYHWPWIYISFKLIFGLELRLHRGTKIPLKETKTYQLHIVPLLLMGYYLLSCCQINDLLSSLWPLNESIKFELTLTKVFLFVKLLQRIKELGKGKQ